MVLSLVSTSTSLFAEHFSKKSGGVSSKLYLYMQSAAPHVMLVHLLQEPQRDLPAHLDIEHGA